MGCDVPLGISMILMVIYLILMIILTKSCKLVLLCLTELFVARLFGSGDPNMALNVAFLSCASFSSAYLENCC